MTQFTVRQDVLDQLRRPRIDFRSASIALEVARRLPAPQHTAFVCRDGSRIVAVFIGEFSPTDPMIMLPGVSGTCERYMGPHAAAHAINAVYGSVDQPHEVDAATASITLQPDLQGGVTKLALILRWHVNTLKLEPGKVFVGATDGCSMEPPSGGDPSASQDAPNDPVNTAAWNFTNSATDPTHTLTLNLALGLAHVAGEKIVIVEDDDWYSPDYLEWMDGELDQVRLAGEGRAIYYNVTLRAWYQHNNTDRASLCSTGFSSALLPSVARLCRSPDPFLDMRLWRSLSGRVTTPSHRRVIGIKGMPGRKGIGIGHRTDNPRWQADHDLVTLHALIGSDAAAYTSAWMNHTRTDQGLAATA